MWLLAAAQPMVFMLASNASQIPYSKNTATNYRVELPCRVVLNNNDYDVMLAIFTYHCMWYKVPTDQAHTVSFTFLLEHKHAHSGDKGTESPCIGTTLIWSHRTMSPSYYNSIQAVLTELNGHDRSALAGLVARVLDQAVAEVERQCHLDLTE